MKKLLPILNVTIVLVVMSSWASAATPAPTETSIPPTEAVPPTPTSGPFGLTSTAFEADAAIPDFYSCHGGNDSPPLSWGTPPSGTRSFALVMDDPDAVQVVGYAWVHWLLFNIPASRSSLPEGLPLTAELTDGSRHGRNNSNSLGYFGPCPPSGQTHRYVFTLYAVDTVLDLLSSATKNEIVEAMDGHVLAQAELSGTYTSP
jgi:Raf kinase inhibitor-like YbhB/YbcL family protein